VLTSGGDAPGMNAALRAIVLVARDRGLDVVGVRHGYRGLFDADLIDLGPDEVADIIRHGGTVLGTARCPDMLTRPGRDTARRRLADVRCGNLIVIGGNGSLAGAHALIDPAERGDQDLRVIGIPASIDNDIGHTRLAIGVDTAMNTIVDAVDKIADTAAAHDRAFIVEVMGRDCGYLAMSTSVAAGADVVLFRESGKSTDAIVAEVADAVQTARRRGRGRAIIIKAEGVQITVDALKQRVDALLTERGERIETRVVVLGHIVRGGRPSAADRLMATRLGHAAVRAIIDGERAAMVGWSPGARLPAGAYLSPADPRIALVPLDEVLAETTRLHDATSPEAQWRAKVFDEMGHVLRV
jgi:6-phosphofructokinase 1